MAKTASTANRERKPAPFGALLVTYRTASGLTQEQLAARAGLSPDAVGTLERGKRRTPRFATVALLADALELGAQERAQFIAAARGGETRAESVGAADTRGTAATERARAASGTEPRTGGAARNAAGDLRRQSWRSAAEPTPLVDRTPEMETILRLLRVKGVRLLTLVGPAGVGKTRLALAAAARLADGEDIDRFSDGITLVDLTPVREPALVLNSLASAVGLLDVGSRPLLDSLVDALKERQLLLVLDNFEQVLPAAAGLLADLLASCPHLTLLVTSRVPLQLRAEQTLRIAPLPVPDLRAALPPLDVLLTIPSVELFVERIRARQPEFLLTDRQAPLVAQVTVQLDGLPLALELAAARLDVLPLPALARRLGDRLRLLTLEAPDRPTRLQSLEAAVSWSYDLLSEAEQRVFRCLGVFVGCVSLDAIAAVGEAVGGDADDGEGRKVRDARYTLPRLLSLAEKSLLLPTQPDEEEGAEEPEDENSEPAFGMLETVREYAQERLAAAGELEVAQQSHAHYFLALAEHADPQLRGPDQRAWYFRLERELDNLRAALRWLLNGDDQDYRDGPDIAAEREAGLRLAGALGWFWLLRGYQTEGRRWLEEALAHAPAGKDADLAVRTRALLAAGPLLTVQGEAARAQAVLEEALALAQQRRDAAGIAQALSYLGLRAVIYGDMAMAHQALVDAQTRWEALGECFYLGFTLNLLGAVAFAQGDNAHAESLVAAALERLAAAGDKREAGITHINFAAIAWQLGDPLLAASHLRAGLHTSVALHDRFLLAQSVRPILGLTGEHIDPERQARLLGAADTLSQATGGTRGSYERLPAYPSVAAARARLEGERWGAAYREGQSLPLADIAALALILVDEAAQIQAQSSSAPQCAAARSQEPHEQPSQHPDRSLLSAREQEVLRLVAQGCSNKTIGHQLFLAPSTVNHHMTAIFNKLGVDTRAHAVAVAAQRCLL